MTHLLLFFSYEVDTTDFWFRNCFLVVFSHIYFRKLRTEFGCSFGITGQHWSSIDFTPKFWQHLFGRNFHELCQFTQWLHGSLWQCHLKMWLANSNSKYISRAALWPICYCFWLGSQSSVFVVISRAAPWPVCYCFWLGLLSSVFVVISHAAPWLICYCFLLGA